MPRTATTTAVKGNGHNHHGLNIRQDDCGRSRECNSTGDSRKRVIFGAAAAPRIWKAKNIAANAQTKEKLQREMKLWLCATVVSDTRRKKR